VIIHDFGSADSARVTKIIRSHLDDFPAERIGAMPCTLAEGLALPLLNPFELTSRRRAHPSKCWRFERPQILCSLEPSLGTANDESAVSQSDRR
jgi:hypothetical protein